VERKTTETELEVEISLDDFNDPCIKTDVPFFNHMLEQLGKHSGFALRVEGKGDTEIDSHHLIEDTGLTLGDAFSEALAERRGIRRYASLCLPFDETLVRVAIDISGRPYLDCNLDIEGDVEGFPLEVLPEFFRGFTDRAGITLHIDQLKRGNRHHLAEATFKAVARGLKSAAEIIDDSMPSTKGTLTA
jgi:imidazoleglycerol-phosphate dehydratase